ncbi:MAG TPA: ATP synthase subunit I [Anaerolineae bacterium]|nr:ATP synthase subunit I [Anaerolineae bacterium]
MSSLLWLVIGMMGGILNLAVMARTVAGLRPGREIRAVSGLVAGFGLRLILATLLLVAALRHSAVAGLCTFAGLWIARWLFLFWWRIN